MAERSLRGSNLGFNSLESDEGVAMAPRQRVEFVCPQEHVTIVPFSIEAEVPDLWECRCGGEALRRDSRRPDLKPARHVRTHWDMLMERRTIPELEELLAERLDLLRSGIVGPGRSTRRSA